MIVFGNLLSRALNVIPSTPIYWLKYNGRTINEMGIEVATYNTPVLINKASCQPIENREYESLKLNLQKKYLRVFATADISVFENTGSPDKIIYDKKSWTVVSNQRWNPYDSWNELICVQDKSDFSVIDDSGNLQIFDIENFFISGGKLSAVNPNE